MIAADTNVVLRHLLQDDEEQSRKASKLFEGDEQVLLTDAVLVETVWTLRGKRYQLPREALIEVLYGLIEESRVVFEDSQAVWWAVEDYASAKSIKSGGKTKQADFADALILNKAQRYVAKGGVAATPLYTFDKAVLELEGTREPE